MRKMVRVRTIEGLCIVVQCLGYERFMGRFWEVR